MTTATVNAETDLFGTPLPQLGQHSIVSIEVEGLLHQFSYSLRPTPANVDRCRKLLILYGDNGSGKTTILNLISHMLSPENGSGHRTAIARTPFLRFALGLADGSRLEATRTSLDDKSYNLRLTTKNSSAETFVTANEEGRVTNKKNDAETLEAFIVELSRVGTTAYFLRDDRKLRNSGDANSSQFKLFHTASGVRRVRTRVQGREEVWVIGDEAKSEDGNPITSALIAAAKELHIQLHKELSEAMREGNESTNTIYENVIRSLIHQRGPSKANAPESSNLKERLQKISEALAAAESYRVGSPAIIKTMADLLENAPGGSATLLDGVLRPYVEGLEARVAAVTDTIEHYESLSKNISRFFGPSKRCAIDADQGLRIIAESGRLIPLRSLSSGERQLALMLIRATLLGGGHELFIIDEPEISLNVKWQRKLVPAILECAAASPAQVILASHSVQMVGPFEDHILRLP